MVAQCDEQVRNGHPKKVKTISGILILVAIFISFYLWQGWLGLALFTLLFHIPRISIRPLHYSTLKYRQNLKRWNRKIIYMFIYGVYWPCYITWIYMNHDIFLSWRIEVNHVIQIVGFAFLALYIFFGSWAVYLLGWRRIISLPVFFKGGEEGNPTFKSESNSKLIVTGPYSLIRHPIYFFELAMIVGVFLITGVLSILFILLICAILIYPMTTLEEAELKERFGREYEDYVKRVPRLFPKIRGIEKARVERYN